VNVIMKLSTLIILVLAAGCGGSAADCNCQGGNDAGVAKAKLQMGDSAAASDAGQDSATDAGQDTGTVIPDANTPEVRATEAGTPDTGQDTGADTGAPQTTPDAGTDTGSTCVPAGYRQVCNSSCSTRPDGCGGFINCGVPPTCEQLNNICQQWNWACGGTQQVVGCLGGGPHGTPCMTGDAGT
jgi:hypothetical protein